MWVDSVSPRTHRLLNENCNTRHEIPPYKLLVREVPEVSKTAQSVDTNLGLPPQLQSKSLLLKILHILTAGHRKINSKSTGNLTPYWPTSFISARKGAQKQYRLFAKAIGYASKPDGKAHCWRKHLYNSVNMETLSHCPTYNLDPPY